MKNVITLYDDNGDPKDMYVLAFFDLDSNPYHFIIYTDQIHYYVAKYIGDGIVSLDTSLTDLELQYSQTILDSYLRGVSYEN